MQEKSSRSERGTSRADHHLNTAQADPATAAALEEQRQAIRELPPADPQVSDLDKRIMEAMRKEIAEFSGPDFHVGIKLFAHHGKACFSLLNVPLERMDALFDRLRRAEWEERDRGIPATDFESDWLRRFHEGDRSVLEQCYREHFNTVSGAVGRVLGDADRETAVHEIFLRLLTQDEVRRSFEGGSLRAWLGKVARNHAVDFLRRHVREDLVADPSSHVSEEAPAGYLSRTEGIAEARLLVERFRRDHLPPAWEGVFRERFLEQHSQREAAAALGIRRTTLAYQELRIRHLLRRFLRGAPRRISTRASPRVSPLAAPC